MLAVQYFALYDELGCLSQKDIAVVDKTCKKLTAIITNLKFIVVFSEQVDFKPVEQIDLTPFACYIAFVFNPTNKQVVLFCSANFGYCLNSVVTTDILLKGYSFFYRETYAKGIVLCMKFLVRNIVVKSQLVRG